jgi:hypothetical protein
MSEIKAIAKEGRDPVLERRRAKAGISAVRILGDLVDTYLARREGDIAPKSLQSEREQLRILRDAIGDRLLADIATRHFQCRRKLCAATAESRSVKWHEREPAFGRDKAHVQDGKRVGLDYSGQPRRRSYPPSKGSATPASSS